MNLKILIKLFSIIILLLSLTYCGQQENDPQNPGTNKPEKERIVPVEVMIVKSKNLEQKIPLTGVVEPFNSVDLIAELSGKVTKVNKELGEYISTKDTLAFIDDVVPYSQFKQAESQVLTTETNLKIAQTNLQSDKTLFENGDISKLAYDNSVLAVKTAEANHLSALAGLSIAKKSYEDTRITSPINGFISRKNIDLGTMVNPGFVIYRVIDLSKLKIFINIPQEYINSVRINNKAIITVSALNHKTYEGTVKRISPQADENTGGFNIEIHVNNDKQLNLRAGMTAKIDLILSNLDEQLVIPDYSIVTKNGDQFAYKVSNGIAKLSKVVVSETAGHNAVVEDGIAEGDTIVVVGMKNLGLETKVSIETVAGG